VLDCAIGHAITAPIAQSSTFLAQVSGWLDRSLDGGRLGTDDGTDPADAVGAAWTFLSDARGSAAALARDLSEAQQQLSAVNGEPSRKEPRS
jgi:hypothetical protein